MMTLNFRSFNVAFCLTASVLLASCGFFNKTIRYDVRTDKKTGIIYNEEWDKVFDAKNAYYNKTDGLLNVRRGPGDDYQVTAYLKQHAGGFVRDCNFDLTYCYIDFGGAPKSGWVEMKFLTEGEIEYKP